MADLISIIVPVYKVELYLDRCVQSLVNQVYTNIEIILVDDGSPDQCPQLCDEWTNRDSRIKVIHKENGGLSDARNVGIINSSGEYVAFVDSDDCVDENFIDCLYSQIKQNKAQISCVDMLLFSDDEEIKKDRDFHLSETYNKTEAIAALFDKNKFQNYICNKLFKKTLFDSVMFPGGKWMEDLATTYRLIEECEVVSYCPTKLYFYYQRPDSVMNSGKFLTDWYWSSKERYCYIEKNYPNLLENYRFFNGVILQTYPILPVEEVSYAEKEFKKNIHYGIARLDSKIEIKFFLFVLSKKIYCYIWKLWQKK